MISTLGEALSNGWTLRVYCRFGKRDAMTSIRACTAYIDVDLETLVWTRGRDFPIARLDSRLKCPRCGSRRVLVAFQPPKNTDAKSAIASPHWTKRIA
jgi:DNA-directed RNA polymerase subunit RPC12/RpoP